MIHKIGVPAGFVRSPKPRPVVDKSDEIPRFWKSKETGDTVQVTGYMRVHPEMTRRVTFLDPSIGVNASCSLEEFKRDFYPIGNTSSKF